MMLRRLLLASPFLLLGACRAEPEDYNRTFAGALEDPLGNLPLLIDAVPWQVSSYDRTGGNNDGFDGSYSFLRTTSDGQYVIFEQDGPGMLNHLWFTDPAPAERIRFFFDAERSPRLDLPILDLFSGERFPFLIPLVGDDSRSSGGFYVYLPMPYREKLRITTTGIPRFYHIGYLDFDDARGVESFDPAFDAQERMLLHASVGRWERRGDATLALPRGARVHETSTALAPGERVTVFELAGSGIIDGMVVETDPELDWEPLREVRILAYWDGAREPSVSAPLRDFFGTSYQPADYASLPLGMLEGRFYSYFRMPFGAGARIEVENGSKREVGELRFRILFRPLEQLPRRMGRFHAQSREERAQRGKPIEILRRSGRGHYVGVTMSMLRSEQARPGELIFLEGDEQIYIDGDPRPHLHGTGTEDFFNGGWYFARGTFSLPFHGHHFRDVEAGKIAAYRFHVLDPVPYRREIQAFIEHGMANERAGTRYRLVAYWYEDPSAVRRPLADPFQPPPDAPRIVPPARGAATLREVATRLRNSGDPLAFGLFELLAPGFRGGHLLRFDADAPGDFLELPAAARIPDRYGVRLAYCRGPQQGIFQLQVGGRANGPAVDAYAPTFEPNVEAQLGDFRIDGKSKTIRLVITGKNPASRGYRLALSGLDVHSLSEYAERWWVLGPFDNRDRSYFESVTEIEKGKIRLDTAYRGQRGQPIRWQKVLTEGGILDFDRIFGDRENAVAYALTYLHADRASDAATRMMLGSDDGLRVYVGWEKIHENKVARGLVPDQDEVLVRFRKGVTPILIKIYEETGGWGLTMRINDPEGSFRYAYQ